MILLRINYIVLLIIYFIYFAIIQPFLHRIHFTKRRLVLTWVFFWFLGICCVFFTFLAVLIPVTLFIVVFTSLFTCVAIFVVARKRMLKRNELVHSNSDQDSFVNLMVFQRELSMAWWFSAVFLRTTKLNK